MEDLEYDGETLECKDLDYLGANYGHRWDSITHHFSRFHPTILTIRPR